MVNTAIKVGVKPYCCNIIKEVVNTAGPTIKGVPNGTLPNPSLGNLRFLTGLIILLWTNDLFDKYKYKYKLD